MIKVKDEWLFDEAAANPLVTIPNEEGHLGGSAAKSCWWWWSPFGLNVSSR